MTAESQISSVNAAPKPGPSARQKQIVLTVSRVWAWFFLAGLITFFAASVSVSTSGAVSFVTVINTENILLAIEPVLLMALGQTFVIIAAGIDLSVGWVMGLSSVVSALVIVDLVDHRGASEPAAIVIGIIAGLIAAAIPGLINGVLISRFRTPAFIATLGMSFVARGLAFILSGGNVVGGQPPAVSSIGNELLLYVITSPNLAVYFFQKPDIVSRSMVRLFQWPVIVALIAVFVMLFILRKTQFGRHTYAMGGNLEAARRAGVPVNRNTVILYVMAALSAGIAGVMHTMRFNGGSSIAGDPLLLSSIAAVVIGGVSLSGGHGNISGTLIGSLIIAVLTTGLVMLNINPFWQYVVIGVVIVVAVLIDQARDLIIGHMRTE